MQFIQHNIGYVALAVLSAIMLLWPTVGRRVSGVKDVGTMEATQLINHQNAVVLDVREDSEFYAGHIPHSVHVPLGQLAKHPEMEKYKDRPIIAICRSGMRSGHACSVLRKNGFEQVYNLSGGIAAWQQANMPMEK
ncbi:MAG: rhodanese-like domain-containing protein [Betaproteobacteria bacterium]|nr:rhodanese-like domain-containing protein [Betaproteobacteria bacterium]